MDLPDRIHDTKLPAVENRSGLTGLANCVPFFRRLGNKVESW